ncbi:hypothetical protein [Novosphingobium rosa]|uniref:hypothetical protein n=1 Tax=Novosphingobium rosa TaxID=76978 RepID=UPI000834E0AE|nr:hypothetical protein [Novosphingobium rosa]
MSVPPPSPRLKEKAITFEALLLVVMVMRVAAHFALPQPLSGEALTSFTAARELAAGHWPSWGPDHWGLGAQALHALGYPLLLAPVMAVAGATPDVAFSVNLVLAMISAVLVWQVARQMGLRDTGQKLSILGYALWLPGIWNCTLVTRENLGTALLLLSAWLALRLLREGPRMGLALAAGATWAAGLLTEPSLLPAISAPVLALVLAGHGWRLPAAALALAAGAALMLGPWSLISGAMAEIPGTVLATLAAATDAASTPVSAPLSNHAAFGLQPWDVAIGRLALFWMPHMPDAGAHVVSRAITFVRIGEVTQYVLIFTLGLAGLLAAHTMKRQRMVLGVLIAAFWVVNGSLTMDSSYRDPLMPLLIVLASAVIAELVYSRPVRQRPGVQPLTPR